MEINKVDPQLDRVLASVDMRARDCHGYNNSTRVQAHWQLNDACLALISTDDNNNRYSTDLVPSRITVCTVQ
jgi:hypothetical protein